MLGQEPNLYCFITIFLIFSYASFGEEEEEQAQHISHFPISAGETYNSNDMFRGERRAVEEEPINGSLPQNNTSLVLAAQRTYRKDPLNGLKRYSAGWNITNRHYWASVGFTAAPFFAFALAWFVIFGICLLGICLCYCYCPREPSEFSRTSYALSLILFLLTIAIVGCFVLYSGQQNFHSSTINTLDYVVQEASTTARTLKDVSDYLSAAKQIAVDKVLLLDNVQSDIDEIQPKINASASDLTNTVAKNKDGIKNVIESVRVALIVLPAVMLILTFLQFVLSAIEIQFPIYILVVIGWLLVTATFVLCGVFLLLHNATGDACVAMKQWAENPTAHTALDDILPCADNATVQDTLMYSKEVTSQIAILINTVLTNVSNLNFAPAFIPLYYNQSGPLVPQLCNPYNDDLTNRTCGGGQVNFENATEVWGNYVCQVSSTSGLCVTPGRLTPTFYSQMVAAVNVSFGLYNYGQFLVDLEGCDFVRHTFTYIYTTYCPHLRSYSREVYIGLTMVASSVMLLLSSWVFMEERGGNASLRKLIAQKLHKT